MKKSLVAVAVILCLSTVARADEAPVVQIPEPIVIVRNVLELSDEQTRMLIEMIQARDTAVRPLAQELRARHEALGQIIDTSDAVTIGELVIEIRAIEKEVSRIAKQAATQFEEALTPEQRERLAHIREAAQVCPAIPALQAAGLV